MRVIVLHTIDDLADDLRAIPIQFARKAPGVVHKNVKAGNKLAQQIAKGKAGPHGKNFFKRYSGEMTGLLEGEYGPHDGGTPVGAGYRHDGPNTDLEESADIIGPRLASDVGDLVDRLFW